MNMPRIALACGLLTVALLLAACSTQSTPSAQDVQAAAETLVAKTREFENAVATAAAKTAAVSAPTPTANPPETTPIDTPRLPTLAPTPTKEKLAVAESEMATPTAAPPTSTPEPTPTDTPQLPIATPTEEKLAIGESDVDGNDGDDFLRGSSTSNQGRVILLPGFEQSKVTDPVVFRDRMVFRVEVFDTRVGLFDGAGLQHVTFRIEPDNRSGEVVYERKGEHPGYCVFGGGEFDCDVLVFAENGNRWPAPYGGEILNGRYLAKIDIVSVNGDSTQWRWRFNVEIPGQPDFTPPAPNAARIDSISVQDGRYVVDFQTFGFEPSVPGQHVHFFFNTVPPELAGLPNGDPENWQLYPAGPGQPNASPFTLYTVDQRPAYSTQMCILVANDDHSVNQNTGNCVDLPLP